MTYTNKLSASDKVLLLKITRIVLKELCLKV